MMRGEHTRPIFSTSEEARPRRRKEERRGGEAGAAAGLSQPTEVSQPSMLCDSWKTNRLEHHNPARKEKKKKKETRRGEDRTLGIAKALYHAFVDASDLTFCLGRVGSDFFL